MFSLSESRHGRTFRWRWRYRIFVCHGCWRRMSKRDGRSGVLTLTDAGRLQWACVSCFHAASRRAAT